MNKYAFYFLKKKKKKKPALTIIFSLANELTTWDQVNPRNINGILFSISLCKLSCSVIKVIYVENVIRLIANDIVSVTIYTSLSTSLSSLEQF